MTTSRHLGAVHVDPPSLFPSTTTGPMCIARQRDARMLGVSGCVSTHDRHHAARTSSHVRQPLASPFPLTCGRLVAGNAKVPSDLGR